MKWEANACSDSDAALLDYAIRSSWLPNNWRNYNATQPLIERYRAIENKLPVPTRVPGLEETRPQPQPMFVRGDHRELGETVPRRFLSVFRNGAYPEGRPARLQLAEDLLDSDTPITRRVIVNRIWHHLFGQGLVRTTDNFGRLGERPSHPELLDWLAGDFEASGWSIKQLVRKIVLTKTWQQASQPSDAAAQHDPQNRWLSHYSLRRLAAEPIRDSILALSGKLRDPDGGAPQGLNSDARSLYLRVKRNDLSPFLTAFDFPAPFSCEGRRSVTNVPAQSLAMMNDPMVVEAARLWAADICDTHPGNESAPSSNGSERDSDAIFASRVRQMFWDAFSREPRAEELASLREFYDRVVHRTTLDQQRLQTLDLQIAKATSALDQILRPVREKLVAQLRGDALPVGLAGLPKPRLRWDFSNINEDPPPGEGLKMVGDAAVIDGALRLRGNGYAITETFKMPVASKTLAAWVKLDNLTQRGGAALSIQSPDGVLFDAIVFGEQEPGKWLAGSNVFARTKPFEGPIETEAETQPVHIVITYGETGEITAYRNGSLYGKRYSSKGPLKFREGKFRITLGLRHLPAGGNKHLSGSILSAEVYDQALRPEEVKGLFNTSLEWISDSRVLSELDAENKERVTQLRAEIFAWTRQRESMGSVALADTSETAWYELAHTLMLMKEFIYVR